MYRNHLTSGLSEASGRYPPPIFGRVYRLDLRGPHVHWLLVFCRATAPWIRAQPLSSTAAVGRKTSAGCAVILEPTRHRIEVRVGQLVPVPPQRSALPRLMRDKRQHSAQRSPSTILRWADLVKSSLEPLLHLLRPPWKLELVSVHDDMHVALRLGWTGLTGVAIGSVACTSGTAGPWGYSRQNDDRGSCISPKRSATRREQDMGRRRFER